MPDKQSNTERWGGPGASHENRNKAQPPKVDLRRPGEATNTPFSHVSGGGGERDRHHGHDAQAKRDTEENSMQRRKP